VGSELAFDPSPGFAIDRSGIASDGQGTDEPAPRVAWWRARGIRPQSEVAGIGVAEERILGEIPVLRLQSAQAIHPVSTLVAVHVAADCGESERLAEIDGRARSIPGDDRMIESHCSTVAVDGCFICPRDVSDDRTVFESYGRQFACMDRAALNGFVRVKERAADLQGDIVAFSEDRSSVA
jgi:hypothetical protein